MHEITWGKIRCREKPIIGSLLFASVLKLHKTCCLEGNLSGITSLFFLFFHQFFIAHMHMEGDMKLKLTIYVIFITFVGFTNCHAADFSNLFDYYSSKIYVKKMDQYEFEQQKNHGYVEIKMKDNQLEIYFGWEKNHFAHVIPIIEFKIKSVNESRHNPCTEEHIQYEKSEPNKNFPGGIVNTLYQLRIEGNKLIAIRIQKYYKDYKDKERFIETFQLSDMKKS